MSKSDNIFVRAKRYVKEHPRTSFQDAIKIVAKKKTVSGVKKRKVSGVKKSASGVKKVGAIKRTVKRRVSGTVKRAGLGSSSMGSVERARALVRDIDRLERKRAREKSREMRDIIQLEINSHHDKLDRIKKKKR